MKKTNVSPPSRSIHEYFSVEAIINKLDWKERFELGRLNNDYVAQGILAHQDTVYHTIHKKNSESVLIVFKKNDPMFRVIKELILPLRRHIQVILHSIRDDFMPLTTIATIFTNMILKNCSTTYI